MSPSRESNARKWLLLAVLLSIKGVVMLAYYPTGWLLPVSGLPGHPLSENWFIDALRAIPFVIVVLGWWPDSMMPGRLSDLSKKGVKQPRSALPEQTTAPPCVECGGDAAVMSIETRTTYCEGHASILARGRAGEDSDLYWIYEYPQVRGRFRPTD